LDTPSYILKLCPGCVCFEQGTDYIMILSAPYELSRQQPDLPHLDSRPVWSTKRSPHKLSAGTRSRCGRNR